MGVQSSRHEAVLKELIEWREDICEAGTSSRVVLVEVPSGWGATTVLREFSATAPYPDGPLAISLSGEKLLLAGQAADAKTLSDALLAALAPLDRSRLPHLFGLDTPAGKIGLALGVSGLFVSGDPDVVRAGGLARLRDPASVPVREQVQRLAIPERRALAEAILQEAVRITRDADATLMERTVARLAAHRVRGDLSPSAELREQLTEVQCLLIRGLEQLGDPEAAYQVAKAALDELPDRRQAAAQRTELLKAWLRLARTRPPQPDDPLINEAIGLATTSGALLGPEACVWAAVNLLRRPGPHKAALSLVDQISADLSTYPGRNQAVNQWRLQLAFHTGQAGYPATAQHLLAPVISGGTIDQQNAAQAVLRATDGPGADIRLQIIILEAELAATQATGDDELLRLHGTLAADYSSLGNYQEALQHGTEALRLGLRIKGRDHPDVLTSYTDVARWTGYSGDYTAALRLYRELLSDCERVLGRDHSLVLTVRNEIGYWMSECGDNARALRLYQELLPSRGPASGTGTYVRYQTGAGTPASSGSPHRDPRPGRRSTARPAWGRDRAAGDRR